MMLENSSIILGKMYFKLSKEEIDLIPRSIIINNPKLWRQTIINAINKDINIFKSRYFSLTYERYIENDEAKPKPYTGNLNMALHNLLADLNEIESLFIRVENFYYNEIREKSSKQTIKLIYVIVKNFK